MTWLIRLLLIRLLGKRAVPILGLLGIVAALRGMRARDVADVDRETGRVRLKGDRTWR